MACPDRDLIRVLLRNCFAIHRPGSSQFEVMHSGFGFCAIGAILLLLLVNYTSSSGSKEMLPAVEVRGSPTVITQSCRVVIPPGLILADPNGQGALQIRGSNLEVEFAPGSILRGATNGAAPDEYRGYGIRIECGSDVTIRSAQISGF